jgi:anti-anti-sigma factor
MLHVSTEVWEQMLYFQLSGRMDGGPDCETLAATVRSEITRGYRRFAFNLAEVISMSSEGIGCLVANLKLIRSFDGSMVLVSPTERVRRGLEVTQLLPTVFDVIDRDK